MNTRVQNKKHTHSPTKTHKKKSKSKSKSKEKKFNPKDYLQALIDLQNTNCSTHKKKKSTKRDISSALTIATPALQKTISASKIRSRSSFSQYRRKYSSTTARQPINLNLQAVITQEDNVQYTQKTARSIQEQQTSEGKPRLKKIISLNKNLCAIKIQRAWRNYQTYKMVHRIFLKEDRRKKNGHYPPPSLLHINIRQRDSQKTLKIRRQSNKNKESRRDQQMSQTQKIIMQRYRQENRSIDHQKIFIESPIECALDLSLQSSNMNNNSSVVNQLKQKEAQRFQQVIQMIQNSKSVKSKQEILEQLVKKFQQNKKRLQQDLQNQLQFFDLNQGGSQSTQQNNQNNKEQEQQNDICCEKDKSVDNLNVKEYLSSDSSFVFDYQNVSSELPELKIFQQRLDNIRHHKLDRLEKIDDDLDEGKLSNSSAMKKKDLIYGRYEREKRQIQKNKKQYLFSLTQLKRNAIDCHKQNLKQSTSLSKLRKSFSLGSTIIKSVIQQIKIYELSEQHSQKSLLYNLFSRENACKKTRQLEEHIPFPSPQSVSPRENTPQKQIQQNLNEKNNTQSLKVCSEEIQQKIQKFLIDQFTTQLYLDENLFKYVKPYVEEVYEFKKIPDEEVVNYLESISRHLPSNSKMLERVNQKINPTSREILRIIRDIDFQIDEYELIIAEECFKDYRKALEKEYEDKNKQKCITIDQINLKVEDYRIVQKIYQRQVQKVEKMKKYRNFQRDLKIMYMKSVFNCVNELLIQTKSSNAFMNGRSSIGPGQLTLAIKQYNQIYDPDQYHRLLQQVKGRLKKIMTIKCEIPSFKNYYDLEVFQKQIMNQIAIDYTENQFKWVNYMDEVLQIWEDICSLIIKDLFKEVAIDLFSFF